MLTRSLHVHTAAVLACIAVASQSAPAHASITDVTNLWTAAESRRPAAHVRWDLDWGQVYRDGRTVTNDRYGAEFDFLRLSHLLVRLAAASKPDDADDPTTVDARVFSELGVEKVAYVNPPKRGLVSPEAIVVLNRANPFSAPSVVVAVRGSDTAAD